MIGSLFLFAVLLWSFGQRTYFLGDGYLLIRNLPLIGSPIQVFGFYRNSPLTGLVFYVSSQIIYSFTAVQFALITYQAVSILCGLITVFLLNRIAKIIFATTPLRFLFVAGIMSTAVSQMFFAYAENYAVSIVFLLLFIYAALRYLTEDKHLMRLTVAFIALVLSHFGMLLGAPAFLFLLMKEFRSKKYKSIVLNGTVIAIVGLFLFFGVYDRYPELNQHVFNEKSHFLIRSFPGTSDFNYSFLSSYQLLDIFNLMIGIFPSLFLFLPAIVLSTDHRSVVKERISVFMGLLAAGTFLFVLTMKSDLGVSRDWDLFSLYLYPTILLGIMLLLRTAPPERASKLGIVIAMSMFVHTALWITVNNSEERGLRYFESLPNEQLWSRSAISHTMDELGSYYQTKGDYGKTLEYNLKYLQYNPSNVRMMENVGSIYFYIMSDDAHATTWYEQAIAADSKDWQVYNNLGEIHLKKREYDRALPLLRTSESLNPRSVQPKLNIAFVLGEVEGKTKEACEIYLQVLALEPDQPNALLNAGYLHYQLKRYDLAKKYLHRWLSLFPRHNNAGNVRNLLQSLP